MAMPEAITLDGCAPTPLASYLKALGVLRLISSVANHVDGRAADAKARGWWESERFHIRTTLDRNAVCRFFLDEYAPSPIIAPWNGGSGFYQQDNREGFDPLAAESVARRFRNLASAICTGSEEISRRQLAKPPKGDDKTELIAALRAELPSRFLDWLDAAVALSGDRLAYPGLLGTGGIDGRLDFTNNFMRRLVSRQTAAPGLFDGTSGLPTGDAESALESSLFNLSSRGLASAKIGQFAPGAAGGPNGTSGYSADSLINSWDFVLMLEGAVAFAGTATRRHQTTSTTRASFPFSVSAVGAGSGGVDAMDENDMRASEFWAPLWSRPVTFGEIAALLCEGRAVLRGRTARDGLEFARAVTGLGVSRGIAEFERYAFLKRAGDAYRATPLGRFYTMASPQPDLIADLEVGGWLERTRRWVGGKKSPAHAKAVLRRLQDALFQMTDVRRSREGTRNALVALGGLARWMATNPKVREALRPPPLVAPRWSRAADDGSPEFRVAAALAGLGSVGTTDDDQALPMAGHFAPVDGDRYVRSGRSDWSKSENTPNVVWGTGSLMRNMVAVLQRRLVEAKTSGRAEKPFASVSHAHLADVLAFLTADFDDSRCAALLAGLIWARPAHKPASTSSPAVSLPFAYAALKPLFTPDAVLRRIGLLTDTARLPVPPDLVARLRAGGNRTDGRATDAAVQIALARARGSGVSSPFDPALSGGRPGVAERSRYGAGLPAERLAAALLIPINDRDLKTLARRAFMETRTESNEDPMEDTTDAT